MQRNFFRFHFYTELDINSRSVDLYASIECVVFHFHFALRFTLRSVTLYASIECVLFHFHFALRFTLRSVDLYASIECALFHFHFALEITLRSVDLYASIACALFHFHFALRFTLRSAALYASIECVLFHFHFALEITLRSVDLYASIAWVLFHFHFALGTHDRLYIFTPIFEFNSFVTTDIRHLNGIELIRWNKSTDLFLFRRKLRNFRPWGRIATGKAEGKRKENCHWRGQRTSALFLPIISRCGTLNFSFTPLTWTSHVTSRSDV